MAENTKSSQDDDFIDLSLIIDVLKDQWRVFSIILIAAITLGVTAYSLVPSRWQAEATLRMGEIASLPLEQSMGATELIEPIGEAVARMQLVQFQNTVINSPKLQDLDQSEITLFRKTFKAAAIKGTFFIHVSVSARSPENASKILEAVIETLLAVHNEKTQPVLQQIQGRVENLSGRIALKQKNLDRLKQILQEGKTGINTVPALDLLDRQEADIQELTDERAMAEGMLRPLQTFNTKVTDDVRVEGAPHFPRLSLFMIAAILAGGLLGMLAALYKYRRKRIV